MSIIKDLGRQEVISASVAFAFGDFTVLDGTPEPAIRLPQGAELISGRVTIDVAFDDSTSDTLDVGLAIDDDEYLAGVDAQALGSTPLVATGEVFAAPTDITIGVTSVTGDTAAGSGRLDVEYRIAGRTAFSQE